MESLFATYSRLLNNVSLDFKRYIYTQINWNNRLIIIRGAKGIGKTTMVLQRIKEAFPDTSKAFYASVDNLWFGSHTILSLIDYLYTHGTEAIFLDEVHKYPNWKQEIKNAYDSYPDLKLIITGSSMLELTTSAIGDLSRRARLYTMRGLSFREYLNFEYGVDFKPFTLSEILSDHASIVSGIINELKIIPLFEKYILYGFYPFYKEEGDGYADRLARITATVIENEIPAFGGIEYSSVYKIKKLLSIMAEQTPYTLNVSALAKDLESSRENVIRLISLLDKAALTINLYPGENFKSLAKPIKILFDNTNLMHALSTATDEGTMRETFFASQLIESHRLAMPIRGDFLIDNRFLFEVGGPKKGFTQIKDIPESYVVRDNLEVGYGNIIPIWLFGFIY